MIPEQPSRKGGDLRGSEPPCGQLSLLEPEPTGPLGGLGRSVFAAREGDGGGSCPQSLLITCHPCLLSAMSYREESRRLRKEGAQKLLKLNFGNLFFNQNLPDLWLGVLIAPLRWAPLILCLVLICLISALSFLISGSET